MTLPLRLPFNDRYLTFEKLFDKEKSFSIHPRNLHVLATDMYEVYSNVVVFFYNNDLHFTH